MGGYSSLSIEELAKRCSVSGEIAAWEEFVRRFHRLIAKVVLRAASRFGDPSKETVEDLIQETYLKLCADNYRVIRNFEHRHPDAFVGFVQVIAANVVRDHFKSSYSEKRGSNRIEGISDEMVPVARDGGQGSPKAIERSILIEQVKQHLEYCVPEIERDQSIRVFWLYYRAGLSARAIAELPGINLGTKGVESLIFRIKRELQVRIGMRTSARISSEAEPNKGILSTESF